MESDKIKVSIRIRPLLLSELANEDIIDVEENKIKIGKDNKFHEGSYDKVFNKGSSQSQLFDFVKDEVAEVINGINCTLFAYGQTNSGKTYTMFGSDWTGKMDHNRNDFYFNPFDDNNGLVPRAINHIFSLLDKNSTVYCSFLQIYNEKLIDLLEV
jgi:kinesin family protein 11